MEQSFADRRIAAAEMRETARQLRTTHTTNTASQAIMWDRLATEREAPIVEPMARAILIEMSREKQWQPSPADTKRALRYATAALAAMPLDSEAV